MTDQLDVKALIDEVRNLDSLPNLLSKLMPTNSILEKLVAYGDVAVEQLIVALNDPSTHVRTTAARALGEIRDPRSVRPLVAALRDVDPDVRRRAVQALSEIGEPSVIEVVIRTAFQQERISYGENALASSIAKFGAAAVEPLIAALGDRDKNVRCGAARALGELRDPRTIEPLIIALRDVDSVVRYHVSQVLQDFQDPRVVAAFLDVLLQEDDALALKVIIDALIKFDVSIAQHLLQVRERNPVLISEAFEIFPWHGVNSYREEKGIERKSLSGSTDSNSQVCPVCDSNDMVISFHFSTPEWTWQRRCGRAGTLTVCDRCNVQIDFNLTLMN